MKISECRILDLPRITDSRGDLTYIENGNQIPFDMKRVYYLYNVPNSLERGEHAHKKLQQLIIAISGSFDVVLDDGTENKRFHLARAYYGLYVCPMIWRRLENFSQGSVAMVLASDLFDEDDYFRDYNEFLSAKGLIG